jgi:NAD+ synthase (glutamine-hydrolysing)
MSLRIALGQINPVVGDIDRNVARMVAVIDEAKALGADLVAFPELAVAGYPPEDLILRPHFLARNRAGLETLAQAARGIVVVAGFVDFVDDAFNAAAVCAEGQVRAVYHKMRLPNYGVFDEYRYFQAGVRPLVIQVGRYRLGVTICEDIWVPGGPAQDEVIAGNAMAILNISASPYHRGKICQRENMLATRASDMGVYLAYCNLVGGQDELVFDGTSVVLDQDGAPVARGRSFAEDLVVCDLDAGAVQRDHLRDPRVRADRRQAHEEGRLLDAVELPAATGERRPIETLVRPLLEPDEEMLRALVLGTRDYVRKNGFEKVLLGLSGGVDSALVAAIAVEALGPANVLAVFMPSRFSSRESREDAEAVAKNLGFEMRDLSIEPAFKGYEEILRDTFRGRAPDITEENLQARIRGNLLMAMSNKFGHLVLSTGNKSENAVGYATLYGDMAGGFAVIKDCTKEWVYRISRRINQNAGRAIIPERVLTKPPTAELRPDQKDTDSLPPYEDLDPILELLVEQDRSVEEVIAAGHDAEIVRRVSRLIDRAEYKRRQAAPGVRLTPKAFGKDRRLPITNRFRDA